MTGTSATDDAAVSREQGRAEGLRPRVGFAEPRYAEIMDFVNLEKVWLDRDLLHEWLGLLTDDISYTIPSRSTVHRADGLGIDINGGMPATKAALTSLVRRNLDTEFVWDRDPAPRIRRFVTNITVYRTESDSEYAVDSSILVMRSQYNKPSYDFLSAERQDVLRATDNGWKLARRRVLIDMAVMNSAWSCVIL